MPCRLTFLKGFSRRHGTRTANVAENVCSNLLKKGGDKWI
jgi:hypothetical protein